MKNYDDERCFQWAILSALFPAKCHSDRLSNYLPYKDSIDVSGLPFPLHPTKITLFEKKNPTIAVHCLAYDSESKGFSVLYLSPEIYKRQHAITLLLLDSPHDNGFQKNIITYTSKIYHVSLLAVTKMDTSITSACLASWYF